MSLQRTKRAILSLNNGICKQEEESEVPSEESEVQDEETDTDEYDTDKQNEVPQSKTTFEPWDRIITEMYETLRENFDDTVETYLQQHPEMEMELAGIS